MRINSHELKWKHLIWTVFILGSLATGVWQVSAWAQDITNGIESGEEKDKQHDTLIASIGAQQQQMYDMMRTMYIIDSLEKLDKNPALMTKVMEITNNHDTLPDTTSLYWSWTDSIYKLDTAR